jgi:hypothetical protein
LADQQLSIFQLAAEVKVNVEATRITAMRSVAKPQAEWAFCSWNKWTHRGVEQMEWNKSDLRHEKQRFLEGA